MTRSPVWYVGSMLVPSTTTYVWLPPKVVGPSQTYQPTARTKVTAQLAARRRGVRWCAGIRAQAGRVCTLVVHSLPPSDERLVVSPVGDGASERLTVDEQGRPG